MRIVVFCCENSAYQAARQGQLPAEVDLIRLPCGGRVEVLHMLRAFERGADGVLVLTCQEDNCQSLHGSARARHRVEYAKEILQEIGIDPERLQWHPVTSNMGPRFRKIVADMVEGLKLASA